MSFGDGDALLETPIVVQVSDGFVTDIDGGDEAARLKKTIADAEAKSLAMEKEGKLPEVDLTGHLQHPDGLPSGHPRKRIASFCSRFG